MSIIHSVNILISTKTESVRTRTKACFVLYQLVTDDKDLCQLAFDRKSLTHLAQVVKSITPAPTEQNVEWDEDEPESQACLREVSIYLDFGIITIIGVNFRTFVAGSVHSNSRNSPF